MNVVKNRSLLPNLRDEETVLVENAIRLAIDSIINVLCGVNSARTREYQQMVADRDQEIQRLESGLKRIEHELHLLRRQGCTCELFTDEHGLDPGSSQAAEHLQAAEEHSGFEPGCHMDAEVIAGQQECEMSISLGLFARPPSHASSESHDSAPPSFPGRMCLEQACASQSSSETSGVTSGVSEQARQHLPSSPSSLVVKEEPCDVDAVLIKWEMSEESFREHQDSTGSLFQEEESLTVKNKHDNAEFREKLPVHPDRHQITEGQHLRNKKKSVPMSELPEEAQRLKRAAWRAASRRYYARKVARQQVNPSHSATFPHMPALQYTQPLSFVDKRRTLISHLPEESQIMQREAWRAASRRYYARKMSRHQAEPAQYGHLLQNTEPSGESQESERGSRSNTEGIMCR
ncbi:hypothetical protein JOB18_035500 [Solea senegalensis]|uniref:Uncharacterized protein n=1 Tax=Solea senegalensis TaxID=28829 RepID=A0AAV6PW41_SOLSE|nr:uncharacterized protein LOC122775262 [Solea senegalensis]KAG7475673.1 hypothetical protein JOB18_035500 [Solea senegalensis]